MHYYCLVIMPKGEMPDKDIVEEMMAPGDQNLEVEEHDVECGTCVGAGTYTATRKGTGGKVEVVTCEDCEGTGVVQSTCNSNAWWDWYVIGGRWDGVLIGKSSTEGNSLEDNSCRVADIVLTLELYPHTIVTPDGDVMMNEDPVSYASKPGWRDEARAVLWRYAEHYCVAVDYHM